MSKAQTWATLHPFLESGDILGRGVANAGFIRAFLQADPFAAYAFFLPNPGQAAQLDQALGEEFPGLAARGAFRFRLLADLPQALQAESFHCFHLSDWVSQFTALGRLRNQLSPDIFPITGVTHSLSYARYAPVFLGHLWPGVTPRDAVIATSRSGAAVLKAAFQLVRDNYHLSAREFPAPQIARIPLGVDAAAAPAPDDAARRQARAELQASADTVLILVLGRISHYSKMDVLPLLRALQRLKAGGQDLAGLRLCLAGWTDETDEAPRTLQRLAKAMGVRLSLYPRPEQTLRDRLYQAADIFVSIADNVQETFGLTILEAGLAGLPVIASDYDGYRDTVLDGKTGLLIPSLGPAQTEYTDTLAQLWYDSQYHLRLAQQTAVSVPKLAEALRLLINAPSLRRRLGAAARERILADYTWERVIARYLELWERLRDAPVQAAAVRDLRHPLHFPFSELFAAYPSARLSPEHRLVWTRGGEALYRGKEAPVFYAGVESFIRPEVLRRILFRARKPATAAELRAAAAECGVRGENLDAHILWALKHDFLELATDE